MVGREEFDGFLWRYVQHYKEQLISSEVSQRSFINSCFNLGPKSSPVQEMRHFISGWLWLPIQSESSAQSYENYFLFVWRFWLITIPNIFAWNCWGKKRPNWTRIIVFWIYGSTRSRSEGQKVGGGGLANDKLMETSCEMESQFHHDWLDYDGVAFSIRLLEQSWDLDLQKTDKYVEQRY